MKNWIIAGTLFAYFYSFAQNPKIYSINDVSTFPVFEEIACAVPGSKECFTQQLQTHIRWTFQYPNTNLTGNVYVQFVIDSTGYVTEVQARSKVKAFEKEGIRIIGQIPKLKPAMIDGKAVSMRHSTPIAFNKVVVSSNSVQVVDVQPMRSTKAKIDYFPREQIILEDCKSEEDPNLCLRQYIENGILNVINARGKRPNSIKDTLQLHIVFSVDEAGKVQEKPYEMIVQASWLKEKSIKDIERFVLGLNEFEVQNRKPETFNTRHSFGYKLIFDKDAEKPFEVVKRSKYEGGKVVEVPLFPSCQRQSDTLDKECFQKNMEAHISKNFNYPEEAFLKGISGRVDVMMMIGKDGKVKDIKTQGPHYLLSQEAVRIINLLPRMKPGMIDGKPQDMPYSVPVTFFIN